MTAIKFSCPNCQSALEFPRESEMVVCVTCGAGFRVKDSGSAISLESVESREEAISEEIMALEEELEAIRSEQKAVPLQKGCAVFGLFLALIVVLAVFVTIARDYFGSWQFYAALALTLVIGALRLRRRIPSREYLASLEARYEATEEAIAELRSRRELNA